MSKKNYIGLIVLTFLIVISGVFAYYASTYKGTITTRSKLFAFNVYKIINNKKTNNKKTNNKITNKIIEKINLNFFLKYLKLNVIIVLIVGIRR